MVHVPASRGHVNAARASPGIAFQFHFIDIVQSVCKNFVRRIENVNVFYIHRQPANVARFLRITEHAWTRSSAKLKLSDSKLSARLTENANRLDQMRDVLGNLEKTSASAARALGFPMIRGEKESKRDRCS
jgi:hypothetical protein